MKQISLLIAGAALLAAPGFAATRSPQVAVPVATVNLQIAVTNVRGNAGRIHVDLCRQHEFLKTCSIEAEVKAVKGTTIVTVPNVQPGDYAAQVSYDENGNGKVDRAIFGIPKEGVGFSRDAPIRLSPPKWQDAMFSLSGDTSITLRLRYFMGGDNKP